VLSPGNTSGEMERKRVEYLEAGARLLWEIDPKSRTVAVYAKSDEPVVLSENQTLDGGDVLPGFTLALRELFSELDRIEIT